MTKWRVAFALLIVVLLLAACGDDDDDSAGNGNDDDTPDDDSVDDDADDDADDDVAEPAYPPIVFAHGFLENGDAFADQTQRFATNGYDPERIHAFDWNTLAGYGNTPDALADFIDWVLETDGADRVDLLGHSMGGSLCADTIASGALDGKVAHYVHVASFDFDASDWTIPVMTLSSEGDHLLGLSDVPGADNVALPGLDHLQVATSPESFAEMYAFFTGAPPATTDIAPEAPIRLTGRVEAIGFNTAMPGHVVRVFAFDPATGERLGGQPDGEFVADPFGYWGTFVAEPETYYEFEVADPAGYWPVVRYFREPFTRSDNKVMLRAFPEADGWVGALDTLLPVFGERGVFAFLSMNRAAVAGRDTLTAGGYDLATEAIAPASQTMLVTGFADINFNRVTDGALPGLLGSFPFITPFDYYVDADAGEVVEFVFNGRPMTIRVDARPASAVSIAMFR